MSHTHTYITVSIYLSHHLPPFWTYFHFYTIFLLKSMRHFPSKEPAGGRLLCLSSYLHKTSHIPIGG